MRNNGKSKIGFYIVAILVLVAAGAIARLSINGIRGDDLLEGGKAESGESSYSSSVKNESSSSGEGSNSSESSFLLESEVESIGGMVSEGMKDMESTVSEGMKDTESMASKVTSDLTDNKTEPTAAESYVSFILPIKGTISKQFDPEKLQFSETYGDMRLHNGIDILAKSGSPVKAGAKGKVKSVEKSPLWGRVVTLEHSGGIESRYCGLLDVSVKAGEEVTAGKIIGTVGEIPSECLEESHLHFEIKNKEIYLSPLEAVGVQ